MQLPKRRVHWLSWGIGIPAVLALAAVVIVRSQTEPEIHYHAAFLVSDGGTIVNFSGDQYMHHDPCTTGAKRTLTAKEEQEERAHLHDNVGDVVHVHRAGTVWRDLFINLNYDIPETVHAYRNGQLIDGILDQTIRPDERMLFVTGPDEQLQEHLMQLPTVENIRAIEARSETCG